MDFAGVPNWPPLWTNMNRERHNILKGEIGVLISAYTASAEGSICFLVMEYQSETYVGVLTLEDAAFCQRVSALLKENIGQPIAKIGDLDLPDPV